MKACVGVLVCALLACGRNNGSMVSLRAHGAEAEDAAARSETSGAASGAEDPLADLWERAKDGETDESVRLARRLGAAELMSAGDDAKKRGLAIRALAYTDGLASVAWLAEVARSGSDDDAGVALESLGEIAARPRRAEDPEDALELRAGCDRLLAVARDVARPAARRIGSIRALRMFADRGCVKPADLPSDLDAH